MSLVLCLPAAVDSVDCVIPLSYNRALLRILRPVVHGDRIKLFFFHFLVPPILLISPHGKILGLKRIITYTSQIKVY